MSLSDPVADMLTRIRNGQQASKKSVQIKDSKFCQSILQILVEEGYILSYESAKNQMVNVDLKYYKSASVISKIKRMSRPGLRLYVGKGDAPKVFGGMGISIISTSCGLMTDKQARKIGHGGELICTVF